MQGPWQWPTKCDGLQATQDQKRKTLRWFHAEDHVPELLKWMKETAGSLPQYLDCIDLFGASERMSRTFGDAGFEAISYDIKIDRSHDLTSFNGFKTFLIMALQFLGPVCTQERIGRDKDR